MDHPTVLSRRSTFLLKRPQKTARELFVCVATLFGIHQNGLHISSSWCTLDERTNVDHLVVVALDKITKDGVAGVLGKALQRPTERCSTSIRRELPANFQTCFLPPFECAHASGQNIGGLKGRVWIRKKIVVLNDVLRIFFWEVAKAFRVAICQVLPRIWRRQKCHNAVQGCSKKHHYKKAAPSSSSHGLDVSRLYYIFAAKG